MHRSSGANTLHRAYSSGGSRTLIDQVDDKTLMQGMKGTAMKGEARKDVESPQNYGFTSVVADAKKGADGQIEKSAEGFMSYMGGNRSFPVCGVMDDRRHRLKNLSEDAAKGAVAVFAQKEWGQQILNTEDGQYFTGNKEKKNRMQLVENKNGQKAQQQGQGGTAAGRMLLEALPGSSRELVAQAVRNAAGQLVIRSKSGVEFEVEEFVLPPHVVGYVEHVTGFADAGGGGAGGGGQQGGQGSSKDTGQKSLHKEETDIAVEQNGKETYSQHGQHYSSQRSGSDATVYTEDRKKSSQSTKDHTHMRFQDHRIWNEEEGNFWTIPCLVKKDQHCKE